MTGIAGHFSDNSPAVIMALGLKPSGHYHTVRAIIAEMPR